MIRSNYSVVNHFLKPYKFLYGSILVVTMCASILDSLRVAAFFPQFASLLSNRNGEQSGLLGAIT